MRIRDLPEGEVLAPLESYGVCAGCKNARLGGTKGFVRRGLKLYCPPCDPLPRYVYCAMCGIDITDNPLGGLCDEHTEQRMAVVLFTDAIRGIWYKPGIPGGFTKKDAPLQATRSDDPHEHAKHHWKIVSGQ